MGSRGRSMVAQQEVPSTLRSSEGRCVMWTSGMLLQMHIAMPWEHLQSDVGECNREKCDFRFEGMVVFENLRF